MAITILKMHLFRLNWSEI